MSVRRLADMTWPDAQYFAPRAVGLWPIGAIEAHGPHLPLATDVIISEEMARRAGDKLAAAGGDVVLLPALAFTPAAFASSFAGTVSVREQTASAMIADVARALAAHGVKTLALANSHVDPANLRSIRAACETVAAESKIRIVFPDKCSKPWVLRLPEEFRKGGAHAGYYETSLVLAARPELVREQVRRSLPKIDVDLGAKIRGGATDFHACGGPDAYFGNPAAGSAEDGRRFYDILSDMIVEAVNEVDES
jgi:creatinine amidohydrolase